MKAEALGLRFNSKPYRLLGLGFGVWVVDLKVLQIKLRVCHRGGSPGGCSLGFRVLRGLGCRVKGLCKAPKCYNHMI